MRMIKTAAVAIGLLMSALAQAHPKLLSSTPAEGANGAAPGKIELHFSENLMTQFSGAKLVMTEMPGMAHSPMPMKGRERVSGVVLPFRSMLAGTAVPGVLLSVASMVVMSSAMSGESDFWRDQRKPLSP